MKNEAKIKDTIVFYAKLLDEKGLVNPLEGNLSILDREKDLLYITPSGKRKSMLEADMVAVLKGGDQVGGGLKRSSEYLLHEAALRARPDCNAAVHTHAPYLTSFAYCNQDINIRCSATFALLFEDIPCLPYGKPGTAQIADGIEAALKDHDMVLLGNHGCICVGQTLGSAVAFLEAAEEVMKIYMLAQSIGGVHDIPAGAWEDLCNTHPASKRNRYK